MAVEQGASYLVVGRRFTKAADPLGALRAIMQKSCGPGRDKKGTCMKIHHGGHGYVGLVTGACFADTGNEVLCLDLDERRLACCAMAAFQSTNPASKTWFGATSLPAGFALPPTSPRAWSSHHAIHRSGTPPDVDGSADLRHVLAAARSIGKLMKAYRVVVDKSTVPVGRQTWCARRLPENSRHAGWSCPTRWCPTRSS